MPSSALRVRWRTLAAFATALGGAIPRAQADPPARASASDRSLVLLAPDLPDDDFDERLLDAILAHTDLGGARIDVVRYDARTFPVSDLVAVSRRRAGEFSASGVMWIDVRDRRQLAVYLYEVDGGRLLGRRVPAEPESTAATLETLANIAASVVAESLAGPVEGLAEVDPDSLAAADDAAKPREEPPKPKPKPAPEPSTPPVTWPRLWLGTEYVGSTLSRVVAWQHGGAASIGWGPAPGAFVGLRYDVVVPSRVETGEVVFVLRRHPASVEGGYRFALGTRERADVEIAGRFVVDPIVRRSDASRSDGPVTGDAVRVFVSVVPGVGFGFTPIRQVRLGLRVGADVLLSRARYVIAGEGGTVVVDPHPVRFVLDAGVRFGLIWRPRGRRASPP